MGKKLWIGTLIAAVLAGGVPPVGVTAQETDSSVRAADILVENVEETETAEDETSTINPVEEQALTIDTADDEALNNIGTEPGVYPVGYEEDEGEPVVYASMSEVMIGGKSKIKEKLDKDAVAEVYLAGPDGKKAALTGSTGGFYWSEYDQETEFWNSFYLYRPSVKGTYQVILKDKEGNTYQGGKVIVTDESVVTEANIPYEYDSLGKYVILCLEGVNLGNGDRVHPTLSYQGKVMTKETGEVLNDCGLLYYRLEKLDPAEWEKEGGFGLDLQLEGGKNRVQGTVRFNQCSPYYIMDSLEHAWYDPDDGLTRFQFKEGLNIPAGETVSLRLQQYDEGQILSGSGKISGDGLVSVTLKNEAGEPVAPVKISEWTDSPEEEYYNMTADWGGVEHERITAKICYYPKTDMFHDHEIYPDIASDSAAADSEILSPETVSLRDYDYYNWPPADSVYTDEQKVEIAINSYEDAFDGYSGDLTATILGHTAKLSFKEVTHGNAGTPFFVGTIDLGSDRLTEGVYSATLKKGEQVVGSIGPIYAIEHDKLYLTNLYHDIRNEDTLCVTIDSQDINKEYLKAHETPRGISAKELWENGGYRLEAFAPDGTPVSLQITSIEMSNNGIGTDMNLKMPLPEEARNYSGLFLRLTRNGRVGQIFDDDRQLVSYYEGYLAKALWRDALFKTECITDQQGYFFQMTGYPDICIAQNYNPMDCLDICRQRDITPIQYPMHVVVTKVNRTKPECSFTFNKEDMTWDECHYSLTYKFKASDLTGLSPDIPYALHWYDDAGTYYTTNRREGYIRSYRRGGQEEKLTGVTINVRSPEVGVGQTLQLSYQKQPSGATVNSVSWSSSNTKIAAVDKDTGLVHGISEGEAKITLTADGKKDTVTVLVVKQQIPLTAITLDRTDLAVKVGEAKTIGVTRTPENATETVSFVSDHPEVVAVSATGAVKGLKPGTATITVSGGQAEPKQCLVTVTASLQSLRLDQHSADLHPDDKLELTALVSPAAEGAYVYTWDVTKDHEKDIVSYTQKENGKKLEITALTPGSIKITVTAADADDPTHSLSDSATIWVTGTDLMNGTESEEAAKIGEELDKSDNPSGLWIADLAESYEYNGMPVEPNVAVYAGRVRLRLGKDYTVTCKNNRGPGTGILTVTGKGSYKGKLEQDFLIVSPTGKGSKSIKKATVTLPSKGQYTYTGSPVTPEPVVSLAGETLTPGTDYTLTYFKNTDAGTGYVLVTGTGDYTDAAKKSIKILPVDLSAAGDAVSVKPADAEYRSAGAVPDVVITYTAEGKTWTLRNGVDYKLTVKNNKKTGTATLNVNGLGNFKKSKSVDFKVIAGDLGSLYMDVPDVEYKAKQKIGYFMSKVKVYDENGKALKQKTDYTLNYFDLTTGEEFTAATVVSAGDQIRVTAVGQGNYAGSVKEAEYRIVAKGELKNITKVKPDKIPDQIYDAGAKTPNVRIPGLNESQYEIVGYSNNTEKGTGRVFVRGTGDYCGLKILTFKIVPADAKTNYLGFWRGNAFVKNGH